MIMNKKKQNDTEISPRFLLIAALSVLIVMVAVYFIGAQFRGSGDDGTYDDSNSGTEDQSGFPNDTDGEDNENDDTQNDLSYGTESDTVGGSDVTETDEASDTETEEPETTGSDTETEEITETDPPETETDPPETETDPPETETDPPETETDPPKTETDPPQTETDPPETETDPPKTETDPPKTDPPPTDPPDTDPPPESIPSEEAMLFANGVQCTFGAVYKGDVVYAPVGMLSAMIDSGVALNCVDTGEICTVSAEGLELEAEAGDIYIEVNGRYLPCEELYAENGLVMAPVTAVAKAFGATVTDLGGSVYIGAKTQYITSGDDFYDVDELYWLSRIISAEARNEPFDGKLAVGAVVMNRIRSSEFPNTMYEVLFEENQFSTVDSDAFYRTPSKDSVIAAKMCLEGYLYDSRILFFDSTYDSWAQRNREFLFKLGDHYFYA